VSEAEIQTEALPNFRVSHYLDPHDPFTSHDLEADMYIPEAFKEDRIDVLHDAIRRAGLATLVSLTADGLIASHIPLLLDPEPAPYETLHGHLARPNLQARGAVGDALAIFLGPASYITPSWYPSKRETGKVVPTWNYVAIHAHGTLEFIDDSDHTRSHVTELTRRFEHDRPVPWAPSDAPEDFIASMVRRIIGFRLTITRLEGKWKMSQNRPLEDRVGTANGLEEESKADIAALVRQHPR
jgi:transcriptional regulator